MRAAPVAGEEEALARSITRETWDRCRGVVMAAQARGLPFSLAGGAAFAYYVRHPRPAADVDLYIQPEHSQSFAALLQEHGFEDYYGTKPYERHWIYRGFRSGVILDIIWAMANERLAFDRNWTGRGPVVCLHGTPVRLLGVEELIWNKLYIVQRDRCDWVHVFNLLHACAGRIDWHHLLDQMGEDAALLAGALLVYRWLCPERAGAVPEFVWHRLGVELLAPGTPLSHACSRARLLDTRPWFSPMVANLESLHP